MKCKFNKPVKVLLIIVSCIVGLFILIASIISPIAHHIIEKHSKELCNRIVTMDKLRINLFTGTVTIEKLQALEENDKDVFLTFDKLRVDISLWRLIGKTVRLNEITLLSPNVTVIQEGKHFNFSDIINFYKSDKPKEKKKSKWEVDLRNITLQNGNAQYCDSEVGSNFVINNLGLKIPRIFFSNQQTDIGLHLNFNDGGSLLVKLLYAIESNSYNLKVQLQNFSIAAVAPYLQKFIQLHEFDGELSTDLNITGNLDHILDIVCDGSIQLSKVYATNPEDEKFASFQQLSIDIDKIDIPQRKIVLQKVTLDGLNIVYNQYEDANTFTHLFNEKEETEESDTTPQTHDSQSPFQFIIHDLTLNNGTATYNDNTLREQLSIPVTNLTFQVHEFTLDQPLKMKLDAIVAETGQLKINYDGALNDFSNEKISIFLKNFKLSTISPLSVHYMAHPISDGLMSFADHSTIVNNRIDSKNHVDIYNCVVEPKIKGAEKEFNIPLRAAVYVLTDRKGKIAFDLPVSGDLRSPTFSYKKIIFQTLCNLIVKTVAAPVDLILKSLGKDPDVFADIEYTVHPQQFVGENDDRLNKIADVLKEKTELLLTVQQSIDLEENIREYAILQAKMEYYKSTTNGEMNWDAINKIKTTNPKFVAYVNEHTAHNDSDIYSKCIAMYGRDNILQQVNKTIEMRNQMIINHFTTQGIAIDRIQILELGNKKTPKGKTLVSFNVKINEANE